MGKKGKRGGGRGGKEEGGKPRGDGWTRDAITITRSKENLETYYNEIANLTTNEQKEEFWGALRRDLPNSFRFSGNKGHALAVRKLLQTRYIPEITAITHYDGQVVTPPVQVPWFPDGLAYFMTTPKNVIRKYPPFAKFQKFLVSETSVGNISRQEVVSMIPPLLLDVQPGMTVLDLCAAPGSKSAQLLEMIHRGEEGRVRKVLQDIKEQSGIELPQSQKKEEDVDMSVDPDDDGRATGVLIANDADYKRCHMLVHQLKRLSSPNLIVTNHDATLFPGIQLPSDNEQKKYLKFDRILADVPCSGDGTLRKNVNLWRDWAPINGMNLHVVQVRILVKALQMLKPGGRVVYSTCSMNPVENEAVLSSAIDRCGGTEKIELIDCSNELPGLKRVPGLSKWKIIDKEDRMWNTWEEVEELAKGKPDGATPAKLIRGMFPPGEDFGSTDIPFERAMRVYAHQQDTGGFFIAALHKKAEFKAKPAEAKPVNEEKKERRKWIAKDGEASTGTATPKDEASAAATPIEALVTSATETAALIKEETNGNGNGVKRPLEDAEDVYAPSKRIKSEEGTTEESQEVKANPEEPKPEISGPGPKKKEQGNWEEPFKFLSPDHEVIKIIKSFYDLSPRFPDDRYLVRNPAGIPSKAIYYTSGLVRDILIANDGTGVKFISAGVKMFMKQDAPSAEVCRWRIQSEGMPILQGYVGESRVIRMHSKETLRKLLVEMFPKFADGEWKKLGEIGERVQEIGMGCCVLRVEPKEGDDELEEMAFPLWKSFHSVNLMLPKEDRQAMLLRIFNEVTPLVNNGLAKNQPAAKAGVEDVPVPETDDANGDEQGDDKEGQRVDPQGADSAAGPAGDGAAVTAEDMTMDDVEDAPSP